jgi:hypothetical protein
MQYIDIGVTTKILRSMDGKCGLDVVEKAHIGATLLNRESASRAVGSDLKIVCKTFCEDELCVIDVNEAHNHEPCRDIRNHPYSRRFHDRHWIKARELAEVGVRPTQ